MATFQKKVSHGQTYWYIVESVRVNGKPRPKVLAYLGKADEFLRKFINGESKKYKIKSYAHGANYVYWKLLEKLNVIPILDKYLCKGKKLRRNGLTPGQTLALVILQRAIEPDSKRAFQLWAKTTTLPKQLNFLAPQCDSQHFWDNMDLLAVEDIPKIEKEILEQVFLHYPVSLRTVCYDITNFFTFISSTNPKAPVAQRGKNKQHRADLRQFNLALCVSQDFNVPLFSQVYEGNQNDVSVFIKHISLLRERLTDLSQNVEEITLVFDKGNNSKKGFQLLDDPNCQYKYVASLSVYHDPILKEVPDDQFQTLKIDEETLQIHRSRQSIWNASRSVVMYISSKLREGQIRGIENLLPKIREKMDCLNQQLSRSPEKRLRKYQELKTEKAIQCFAEGLANEQFIREIVDIQVIKENTQWQVRHQCNPQKYDELKKKILGKRILITNQHDWTTEEIIKTYRDQDHVEKANRHLKNPFHHAVRPQYHWTDQKIRVHAALCILSFLISTLLQKTAAEKGIHLSIDTMIEKLNSVRKAVMVTTEKKGKPSVKTQFEEMEEDVEKLFFALQ
jgi:transposase